MLILKHGTHKMNISVSYPGQIDGTQGCGFQMENVGLRKIEGGIRSEVAADLVSGSDSCIPFQFTVAQRS